MVKESTVPRPEYPRPDFVRREWLCLNGPWEFAFDDDDQGMAHRWHDGRPLDGRIVVPFAYQSPLSGIGDTSIHEIVWYARSLAVPDGWHGRHLLLHFGAVDYQATVWVNGREVGHNRGGHVPFWFDIAPYVGPGENRLALRVVDRQSPEQPRGKQAASGNPRGIDYYCTTGIWQTVWLEPAGPLRIDRLRVTPLLEVDAFEVLVYLRAPATGWRVEAEAVSDERVVAAASAETSRAVVRLMLRIPGAQRWTPDSPHLYGLRVRLKQDAEVIDEVETYAGLRSLELRAGRLMLDGEPVYLAMALDQGYWRDGMLTAPSDAALREDVLWARRYGFNGVRKHQKIEDPRWLYWCDRLGLMVWGEMPNARGWSSAAEEALAAEWSRAVERDYNHPCIVTWVPVNESMGFPGLREGHPGQYAFLERMVAVTRALDATRPVIDNDGWEHTDITDICAIHDYSHSGQALVDRYAATTAGGPLPERIWTGSRAIFAAGSRYRGQPVMLTEVGGLLAAPDLPPEQRDRLYKVYATAHSPEEMLELYRDIVTGIARLPFVAGFCYTQLTDIEQEVNGLLTYDRKPKVPPESIREIHRALFGLAGDSAEG